MKYTKKVLQDKKVEIYISLDEKEWEQAVLQAYKKNKGKYGVQGFRKGHVPKKVLEKTYGEGLFYDDAIDGCFYKYYFEILTKEKDLEPVSHPDIEIQKVSKDGLEMKVKIIVRPQVELGEYKNLSIEKEEVKVSKEDVDCEIQKLVDSRVKFVSVDREIKNGDVATIDFSGSVDNKKFDGGTSTDFDLEIGSKSFIDNFEEQLIGLKKGDKKDVEVTFPKNYHEESLKDKLAVFEVVIKDVKEKQYPTVDDTFASEVSEFETLKELKESTKKKLLNLKEENEKSKQETSLIDKIVDNAKLEIPQVMIDEQVEAFIKDFERRLTYQGLNLKDYLKYANTTIEDLKKSRIKDAQQTVKTRLVLEKIITVEKIKVTDKDIEEKFNENSKETTKTIEEIKKSFSKEQFDYFENSVLLNKLLKFLKKNNNLN